MTFKDTGFRAFYHQFCAVDLNRELTEKISGIDGYESAEYALVYGYMDAENGLMVEVLAAAVKDGAQFGFADDTTTLRRSISIKDIEDQEIFIFENKDGSFYDHYNSKIQLLAEYEANEDVEKTREMGFLDDSRDAVFIDNVAVTLRKFGLDEEIVTARIVGLGSRYFIAKLIDEPVQDFGHHKEDTFTFTLNEIAPGKVKCVANLDTPNEFSAEDLADGKMLKEAVMLFNKKRTESSLFSVMSILRDSNVWVPCHAKEFEGDNEKVELIPDVLTNGDKNFMPVFSHPDEMGKYGDSFTPVAKPVLEVIGITKFSTKKLEGLVLNPFSEPFVISTEFFELIEGMNSSLA